MTPTDRPTGGRGVARRGRLLCELADDVGLNEALPEAMTLTKQHRRGHERGQVLVDTEAAIANEAKVCFWTTS